MLRNHLLNKNLVLLAVLGGMLLSGCEGFFGKKTDPSFIDVPVYDDRAVAYVPILPVWDQFTRPTDVVIGYDELIYVVEDATKEIVALDQAGNEQGRMFIPGLTKIAQDRTLDLLAIGTFDTAGVSLTSVYRIDLKGAGGYGLNNATITGRITHPFYFLTSFSAGDANVRFTDIAVRADNRFYITRTGPQNAPTQIGGPDDAVLIFPEAFSEQRSFSPLSIQTSAGFFNDFFKEPVSITTVTQPPQSPFVSTAGDFIVAQQATNTTLKVQYITVTETENGNSYTVREMITGDTSQADGFLLTPNRFGSPQGVTYTGDGTNYLFVVDGEKDSLFQFTNTGLEGVRPPAGSTEEKNIKVSFGGTGNGITQFRGPSSVAYLNELLFVADPGNGRIVRYRLTTDFR